jgi:hypothetical protein
MCKLTVQPPSEDICLASIEDYDLEVIGILYTGNIPVRGTMSCNYVTSTIGWDHQLSHMSQFPKGIDTRFRVKLGGRNTKPIHYPRNQEIRINYVSRTIIITHREATKGFLWGVHNRIWGGSNGMQPKVE